MGRLRASTVSVCLFSFVPLMSGCSWRAAYGDFDKMNGEFRYDTIPMKLVKVGDTKDQVRKVLGEPSNVAGSKRYKGGIIEVWSYVQYEAVPGPDRVSEEYWIYFWNDTVCEWGRPGDWQREADRLYEVQGSEGEK